MKTAIVKTVLAFIVFICCAVIGVNEVIAHRFGAAAFSLGLALIQVPLVWMHWLYYKKQKDLVV